VPRTGAPRRLGMIAHLMPVREIATTGSGRHCTTDSPSTRNAHGARRIAAAHRCVHPFVSSLRRSSDPNRTILARPVAIGDGEVLTKPAGNWGWGAATEWQAQKDSNPQPKRCEAAGGIVRSGGSGWVTPSALTVRTPTSPANTPFLVFGSREQRPAVPRLSGVGRPISRGQPR
jgi:hypothetical protein